MITPNLASRPFLNTRPVWLLAAAATVLAIILAVFNVRFFLGSNRTVTTQMEQRDTLVDERSAVEQQIRTDLEALRRVPWRTLQSRVQATNLILEEHAFSWMQMLDDLERVLPWNVRLTRISPKVGPEGVTLSLIAVSNTREAELQFLDNLLADPKFSRREPSSEKTPEEAEAAGYVMSLRVVYHPQGFAS